MILNPGATTDGTPASTPITTAKWSRQGYISAVLRSDLTSTNKRRLSAMAQRAKRDGTVQIGMRRIALASASNFQAPDRIALVEAGWLEITDEGDPKKFTPKTYRLTVPSASRVSESTQETTETPSRWILRLPLDHDALYQGCHLNATWVVLLLIRQEGAVSVEDLITLSTRSRSQIFKDLAHLKSAGLVQEVADTYQSIDVTAHEQRKILDRLAQEAGTSGKRAAAWERYKHDVEVWEFKRAFWEEEQHALNEHRDLMGYTEEQHEESIAEEEARQHQKVAQVDQAEIEPQDAAESAETYEEAMVRWMPQEDTYDYVRAFQDVLAHNYMGHYDKAEACASMLASIMVTPGAMQTYEARWSSGLGEMVSAGQAPSPLLREIETLYRQNFLFGRCEAKCQRILDKAVEHAEPLTHPSQPSHRDDFTHYPRSVYQTPSWMAS